MTLRTFYPDEDVQFTPEGRYEGKSNPGPWTLWSKVKVRGIKVASDSVTIQGTRVYVFYDAKRKQFRNKEGEEKNWVTINFGQTTITPSSAQAALAKILLNENERMSDFVPREWRELLKLEESGEALKPPDCERGAGRVDLLKVSYLEITPPRVTYEPDPFYQPEARRAKLQGAVWLWAVVDEEGRVPAVRIFYPLGMGLDERAIEAVRNWRFEPAKKDGMPVKAQVCIRVQFGLKSW